MSVKSKIATLEAQRVSVRTEPSPASPSRLEVRVSRNQSDLSKVSALTAPRSEVGIPDYHRPRTGEGGGDNASTTSNTSNLRRNRLLKKGGHQASVSSSKQDDALSPRSSDGAGMSPRSAAASLAERRRARQQRKTNSGRSKQDIHRTNGSNRPTHSNGDDTNGNISQAQATRTAHSVPQQASRRMRPSPESHDRKQLSNLRVDQSLSMASSSLSTDLPGDQQPREQRRSTTTQRRDQGYEATPTKAHMEFDQPTFMRHSPVDPTDDEATLTSVRQIMHSPGIPTLQMDDGDAGEPSNSMTRTMSSSSYDTEDSRQIIYNKSTMSSLLPAQAPRDDDTFDYGDRDENHSDQDDSVVFDQDSVGFEEKRRAAAAYQTKESSNEDHKSDGHPLLTKADIEHYCKAMDTPVAKTAAGIAVAATVGTMLLGPVGLLVGAATVGIGVGVMQIPLEQRTNVQKKATAALQRAHESAISASEALSSTCAASCYETNKKLPMEVKQCFASDDNATNDADESIQISENGLKADERSMRSIKGGSVGHEKPSPGHSKNRRVACLRNGRIVPVQQIHGLEPSQQPRAWLDVMASANTTVDEKNEAMEEIINHAKDKQRARILLDEGVLDSLMYILNCHFDKRGNVTKDESYHAKLAATCCVTLGKAHCAAVHTEGDLLLMSLYERGSFPEERQLAQMLYEVPHHVTRDGKPENFCLQQTSMPKAEDAARTIKALADGRQSPLSQ